MKGGKNSIDEGLKLKTKSESLKNILSLITGLHRRQRGYNTTIIDVREGKRNINKSKSEQSLCISWHSIRLQTPTLTIIMKYPCSLLNVCFQLWSQFHSILIMFVCLTDDACKTMEMQNTLCWSKAIVQPLSLIMCFFQSTCASSV